MKKINHSQLKQLIKLYYSCPDKTGRKTPLLVTGTYGEGKSVVIIDTAKEIAIERERIYLNWNETSYEEKIRIIEEDLFRDYFILFDIRLSSYDACLTENMLINMADGSLKTMKLIKEGDEILGYKNGKFIKNKVIKKWDKGISKEGIVKIHLENGNILETTKQHKFLTDEGWKETKYLNTSNILYIQNSKGSLYNGKIYYTRKKIHKRELENKNSKRNGKNIKQNTKSNRDPSIFNESEKDGITLFKKGKDFYKKELSQNESKEIGKNNEQNNVRNKHNSENNGHTKKLWRSFKGERIKPKQFNGSRKRLFSRNNRWRRNYNFKHEENQQQERINICPTHTNNIYKQYKQKITRMVSKKNENKILNIRKKNSEQKNMLYNRNAWIQNPSDTRNTPSISYYKKDTMQTSDKMDKKKKQKKMERPLFRNRQNYTLTNKKNEFKQQKIQRIDFTNENRQIFDLTTTTGNYLVNGIVCHNSDLKGLPNFNKKWVEWKYPFFVEILQNSESDGIILFDEWNLTTPLVLSSCYQIFHDKVISDIKINFNWLIIGCGNKADDCANTIEIPGPLKDRCAEVELTPPTPKDWLRWAIKDGIHPKIIAYIGWKGVMLRKVNHESEEKDTTERSWARLSSYMHLPLEDIKLVAGTVIGEGVASEFIGFLEIENIVNLNEIIKKPEILKGITDPGQKYFIISGLAEKYSNDLMNIEQLFAVSKILYENKSADFVAMLWKLCSKMNKAKFRKDFISKELDNPLRPIFLKYLDAD